MNILWIIYFGFFFARRKEEKKIQFRIKVRKSEFVGTINLNAYVYMGDWHQPRTRTINGETEEKNRRRHWASQQ